MKLTFSEESDEDAKMRVLNAMQGLVVRLTTSARRVDVEVLVCGRQHDNAVLFGHVVNEEGNRVPRGELGTPVRLIEELHVY